MKTAISIPDDVFESANALAKSLGISRSELFSTAVGEFVAKHKGDEITRRLDELYASLPGTLDPAIKQLQYRALAKNPW